MDHHEFGQNLQHLPVNITSSDHAEFASRVNCVRLINNPSQKGPNSLAASQSKSGGIGEVKASIAGINDNVTQRSRDFTESGYLPLYYSLFCRQPRVRPQGFHEFARQPPTGAAMNGQRECRRPPRSRTLTSPYLPRRAQLCQAPNCPTLFRSGGLCGCLRAPPWPPAFATKVPTGNNNCQGTKSHRSRHTLTLYFVVNGLP